MNYKNANWRLFKFKYLLYLNDNNLPKIKYQQRHLKIVTKNKTRKTKYV